MKTEDLEMIRDFSLRPKHQLGRFTGRSDLSPWVECPQETRGVPTVVERDFVMVLHQGKSMPDRMAQLERQVESLSEEVRELRGMRREFNALRDAWARVFEEDQLRAESIASVEAHYGPLSDEPSDIELDEDFLKVLAAIDPLDSD